MADDAPTASSAKPEQLSKRKQRSSMRLADFRRRVEQRDQAAATKLRRLWSVVWLQRLVRRRPVRHPLLAEVVAFPCILRGVRGRPRRPGRSCKLGGPWLRATGAKRRVREQEEAKGTRAPREVRVDSWHFPAGPPSTFRCTAPKSSAVHLCTSLS